MFKKILEAKRVSEVTDILSELKGKISWLPVGDRSNNLATINIGSDPASGLIERITNAIDAILERKWIELGKPTNIKHPRTAVNNWFNIKDGRLENITNPRDSNYIDLAKKIKITIHESENSEQPTVDIRDYGCGILSEKFKHTILSLNEDLKLKKFFLAGAFGQGGSTTLSYSLYAIIISRALSKKDKQNPVAYTIVRYNDGDPETDKHGLFEYMVDNSTGNPFIVDLPEEEFPTGTLVRHVSMDLGQYKTVMTAPRNSLWYLSHHYLFDPVLPFQIEEQRDNKSKGETRTVGGSVRRLMREDNNEIEYSLKANRVFRNGNITLTWWVFKKPDYIVNFTLQSKPIIITHNGQKQGDLPNTVIKKDLKLPYLEKYLLVHIDCEKMDNYSRRQLFSTTREKVREGAILYDLRQLVIDTLGEDEKLEYLNYERKKSYIEKTETDAYENIKKRLARRIEQFAKTGGGDTIPKTKDTSNKGKTGSSGKEPIPVQEPPSFFEITTSEPKKVYPGMSFSIKYKTDAHPSYFNNPDNFIAIISNPNFGQYTGTTSIHNGYGTAYFKVNDNIEIGETARIDVELRPSRSKTLSDSIDIEVIEFPKTGSEKGIDPSPNIDPVWVTKDSKYWQDNNWDESTVAKVTIDESVTIYVSAENKNLNSLLERAQRKNTNVIDSIKSFYLEHICFHAYITEIYENKNNNSQDSNEDDNETDDEIIFQNEMKRVSETICGIAKEHFDYIAESTEETDDN